MAFGISLQKFKNCLSVQFDSFSSVKCRCVLRANLVFPRQLTYPNVAHVDRWWLLYRSLLCDAETNGAAHRSQLPKCDEGAKDEQMSSMLGKHLLSWIRMHSGMLLITGQVEFVSGTSANIIKLLLVSAGSANWWFTRSARVICTSSALTSRCPRDWPSSV